MPKASRLRLDTVGDVTVVCFNDSRIIDEVVVQELGDELNALVLEQGLKRLLLNFGNVEYLSSAALGKLVALRHKIGAAQGELRLCSIRPDLMVPFVVSGLDQVFKIHKHEQAALDSF